MHPLSTTPQCVGFIELFLSQAACRTKITHSCIRTGISNLIVSNFSAWLSIERVFSLGHMVRVWRVTQPNAQEGGLSVRQLLKHPNAQATLVDPSYAPLLLA
jgi:hypothetical protein